MKKYYETLTTRNHRYYCIYAQGTNGDYYALKTTDSDTDIQGIQEAIPVNSIIAEMREGGQIINILGKAYIINSKRIEGAAQAASKAFLSKNNERR